MYHDKTVLIQPPPPNDTCKYTETDSRVTTFSICKHYKISATT